MSKDQYLEGQMQAALKKIEELETYIKYSGIYNKKQTEILTNFDQTDNEVLLKGKTNSIIVLGSDRPAGPASRKGGVGHTGTSAIDIIAGLGGIRPISKVNNVEIKTSKNFEIDAARVYISQLSNIDEYFSIPKQYVKIEDVELDIQQSINRSCVGIKADSVAIVGREHVKICTQHHGVNSQGNEIQPGGIDLYAGVDATFDERHALEPIPKGNKLVECIQAILNLLLDVQSNMVNFINIQQDINKEVARHQHQISSAKITSTAILNDEITNFCLLIDKEVAPHISTNIKAVEIFKDYLKPDSKKYINSFFNRVN